MRATLQILKWKGRYPTYVPGEPGLWNVWKLFDEGGMTVVPKEPTLVLVTGSGPDAMITPVKIVDGKLSADDESRCARQMQPALWAKPAQADDPGT